MRQKSRILRPITTALILSLVGSSSLAAQAGRYDHRIVEIVSQIEADIIKIREQIHSNPELGNREFETAKMAAQHLRSLGMEVRTGIAHTGVAGILKGGRPGPVVAVRADMDALPVTEQTDLPFKSTKRAVYNDLEVGVMHACGHDVHTAVQLGVASVMAELRDELPGTILFVFQPAEEGPPPGEKGGADVMLEEGLFDDPRPDAVFGLHTLSGMPVGQVGYTIGPALAAVDTIRLTIFGKQTHGAHPDQGIDPIVMASQAVLAFQTIVSRSVDPLQPAVVTIGMFHAGERNNIIPESVRMAGTVRTYDPEVRDMIEARIRTILDGITKAGNGTYELDYQRGTPATINNPDLSRQALPTLESVLGDNRVVALPPTMGGEDFAYYALEVPGFFFRLGIHKEGTTTGPHHSPTFRADNSSIPVGVRAMSNLLIDYLFTKAGER